MNYLTVGMLANYYEVHAKPFAVGAEMETWQNTIGQ